MPRGAVMAEAPSMGSPSAAMAMALAGDRRGPPHKTPQQPTRALVRHHWGRPGGMDWFAGPPGISPGVAGGADVRIGDDAHKIIGDGGAGSHGDGGGGLRWPLRRGRRPSTTMARRSMGATTHLQARQRICRHDRGGHVRHLLTAQRRFLSGARATTIARGGSRRQRQSLVLMGKHTDGSPPASSTGAVAPTVWVILKCDSRRCGVAAASSAPRHGRPPDGHDGGSRWEDISSMC